MLSASLYFHIAIWVVLDSTPHLMNGKLQIEPKADVTMTGKISLTIALPQLHRYSRNKLAIQERRKAKYTEDVKRYVLDDYIH